MKAIHVLFAAAVAAGSMHAYAQGMSMPMNSAAATASKEVPFVNAEVRKVDAAHGKVTLKHENVPNLDMPGMTMAFPVADKKLLKGVKAGEKVRAKFEVVKGEATVTALEAVKSK